MNEEFLELENYGSGFSSFFKDQSKKFIKKAAEKAINTGAEAVGSKTGTAIGELVVNKVIPSKKNKKNGSKLSEDKTLIENNSEIPIDSGFKVIKLLQQNNNSNDKFIITQYNLI